MVSLWMTRRRTSVRFLPVQSPKRRTSVTKKANRHSYMIPYLSLK
ncbi:hypothetical protein AB7M17_008804 [Bradyrhizobium sp. USDA 377]